MSAKKLDPPEKRLCPCENEELTDWRPIGAACFRTANEDDRIELAARGKKTSRACVKRLLDHAASRANAERRAP